MNEVLKANYMMKKLYDLYTIAFPDTRMDEFVVSIENKNMITMHWRSMD
jgi:glycine cleavage system protein P-like pyridoxal-binding family